MILQNWHAIIHYLIISHGVEVIRRYIPKGLTFAEAFSLMTLVAFYFGFYDTNLMLKYNERGLFLAGNISHHLVIFVPVKSLIIMTLYSGSSYH